MAAGYKGQAEIFPARVFRSAGRNELSFLETTLWQSRGSLEPHSRPAAPQLPLPRG